MAAKKKTDYELATGSHRYRWLDGSPLINVTAISDCMDLGKSMGMAYGAAKLTRLGLDFKAEWDVKKDLGTAVHTHLEAFLRSWGGDGELEFIEETDEQRGHVDALEKWLGDMDPDVHESECIVLSSRGYAGRLDTICTPRSGDYAGRTGLIDLKSGRRSPVSHSLQLALYRHADGIACFDDEGRLTGLRPLPEIDFGAALYTRAEGMYAFQEYPCDDEVFEVACGLLDAVAWTRCDQMKQLEKAARTE